MHIRPATESDLETLKELWLAFDRENPSPDYEDVDEAVELSEVEEYVRDHVALLAENGEVKAGFVLARMRGAQHGWISDLYVSPDFRRAGAASRLGSPLQSSSSTAIQPFFGGWTSVRPERPNRGT